MKNKFRSTGFWLSLTGAVLLVIQQFGLAYGFNVNSELVNGIVSSVLGCLVMLGVLIPSKSEVSTNPELLDETTNDELEDNSKENNSKEDNTQSTNKTQTKKSEKNK